MLAAGLTFAGSAHTYEANVGYRAANFGGVDVVSRRVINLDDYFGEWVLIDFWATWCGPCMDELPNLISQTRVLRSERGLNVVTVSCDSQRGLRKLKAAIAKQGIDFPVLYDGAGRRSIPAQQWGIREYPSSYLINPQGVIVASGLRGKRLAEQIRWFMDNPAPPLSLSCRDYIDEAGRLHVVAHVASPQRIPLQLILDRHRDIWIPDPANPGKVIDVLNHYDQDHEQVTLTFPEFGETSREFILEADPGMSFLGYRLLIVVPGSAEALGGEGIYLAVGKRQALYSGIDWRTDGVFPNPDVKSTALKFR